MNIINKNPIVCIITGPSGAGKSSVSKELAKKFKRCAVIDVDKIHSMVVSGRVKPWDPGEETKIQLSLGVKNTCLLTNNFLASNFNVIIDSVIGRAFLEQYSELISGKHIKTFLLLPTLEVVLKRFDERGVNEELRKRTLELHEKFTKKKSELDWQIIDSSNQTLEETASQIFNELVK